MIQKMKDELHQAKTDYRARMKDDRRCWLPCNSLGEHLFELFDKGASVTTLCEYVGTKKPADGYRMDGVHRATGASWRSP